MHTTFLNQWPGSDPNLLNVISELVDNPQFYFNKAFICVAYVSEEGLHEIEPIIRTVQARSGEVKATFGFDPRQVRRPVLESALDMFPRRSVSIFGAGNCILHSKIYFLSGDKYIACIVGSNNLTSGGLYQNWESSVVVIAKRSDDVSTVQEIENFWSSYEDYTGQHKISLSRSWLRSNAALFARIESTRQRQPSPNIGSIFGNAPRASARRGRRRPIFPTTGSAAPTILLPRRLVMQVLRETGDGGTQIQIPVRVLQEYFGIDKDEEYSITIRIEEEVHNARILHFGNNTHRIQMSFLHGEVRPLILSIIRRPRNRDIYDCQLIRAGSPEYDEYFRMCNLQTRSGSKCYAIIP